MKRLVTIFSLVILLPVCVAYAAIGDKFVYTIVKNVESSIVIDKYVNYKVVETGVSTDSISVIPKQTDAVAQFYVKYCSINGWIGCSEYKPLCVITLTDFPEKASSSPKHEEKNDFNSPYKCSVTDDRKIIVDNK